MGFNMFAASIFSFICQLYILPPEFVSEVKQASLKLMLGPRDWLHGAEGHAFFRAHEEVGFPIAIKCIEATNLQMCYATIPKHVPDFCTSYGHWSVVCTTRQPSASQPELLRIHLIPVVG